MPWEVKKIDNPEPKYLKWGLYLRNKLFAKHKTKKEAIKQYQAIEINKRNRKYK